VFDNKSYTSSGQFFSASGLCLRLLDINKNDLVKNHFTEGAGGHLELLGVKPPSIVDLSLLRRVLIRENLIQECTGGAAGIEVSRGTQC